MAGLENRTNILPIPKISQGPGILGPDYSVADALPLPGAVGVREGDDFSSVLDSVKAVGYYVDMIGFGAASSGLTQGVGPHGGPKALGVNTWTRTGMTCSNGAEMWMYNAGIPTGDALGKRVKDGMASAGLPALRGLAPGIMEDAQSALNPVPILKAVFGSGYPRCSLQEMPVGDQDGSIQNPSTGNYYVENPETVRDGRQKRWAWQADLRQEEWDKEPKTHCANGLKKKQHQGGDCTKRVINTAEGYINPYALPTLTSLAVVGVLVLLNVFSGRKFK